MIESNEIRIGNLLLWDRSKQNLPDEIVTVYNVTRTYIRAYTEIEELDEVLIHYEDLKPYLLNEPCLLSLGFNEADTTYDGGHHFWMLTIGKVILFSDFEDATIVNIDGIDLEIRSAHHLQNTVFALTGQELELK